MNNFDDLEQRLLRQPTQPVFHLSMIAAGIVLALLGPFGTFAQMGLPERLCFWVLICWLNALQSEAIGIFLIRRFGGMKPPRFLLLVSAVNAIPCVAEVMGLLSLFNAISLAGNTAALLAIMYAECFFITLVVFSLFMFLRSAEDAPVADEMPIGEPNASAFVQQLAPRLQGDLLAVSSEDHYLRLYGSEGEVVVHGRIKDISDAMAEQGLQVHRSHWVAFDAIAALQRREGRAWVKLSNGISLPVSRNSLSQLKSLGW